MKKPEIIELNFIFNTINQINKTKDFHSVAEIIFNFIEELVKYNMAVIYRINKNELEIVSCRGSDPKRMKKRVPFKIGEGAVGWVARYKKALLIKDVVESEDITVRQFSHEDPIIRSFLAVPLVVGDKLVGILSVSYAKPNQYNSDDAEAISIIAAQGAALLKLSNEITEAKRFSNHILENVNSGVMVIDNNYKILIFNKAAEKISGYTSEKVVGKNIIEIPLKNNNEDWYIAESLKNREIFFEYPGYMIHKDGRHVHIRLSTSILEDENKSIKGCICIFRDNTEIEKLQRQMVRADKLAAIGRLTSGIAHEIRNPLLPIRTASKFLIGKIKDEGEESEVTKLLRIIYNESERLNKFLEQFVNLNKNDLNIKGESDLLASIEETTLLMKHSLVKNNIDLYKQLPEEEIYIPCNRDKLKQIYINLFLNAIDAINIGRQKKREIHIEVQKLQTECIVKFLDTGCGINEEILNNIFDPFYSTKENGTGLGLSIIHNIMNSFDGKISVDSWENKGTEFTLIFPLSN